MRYKKYIEPLWNTQKEITLLTSKIVELEEELSHMKQEIFLYFDKEEIITQDNWVVYINPWKNILQVFTKDEYEKHVGNKY